MDEIMPRKHPDRGFTEIYIHAHKKNLIFLRDLKLRSAFKRNFFLPLSKKSFVKEFHDGGTSIESMRTEEPPVQGPPADEFLESRDWTKKIML